MRYTSLKHFARSSRRLPAFLGRLLLLMGAVALASSLAACGTLNERLAAGLGDVIPTWAGGLPADAPPRPGTVKYDEYMRERERKRLIPASEREDPSKVNEAGSTLDRPENQ